MRPSCLRLQGTRGFLGGALVVGFPPLGTSLWGLGVPRHVCPLGFWGCRRGSYYPHFGLPKFITFIPHQSFYLVPPNYLYLNV